jgi:hypothetical protein
LYTNLDVIQSFRAFDTDEDEAIPVEDSTDLALHAIDEELTKSSDVSEAGEGSGSSEASSVASAVRTDFLSLHAYLAFDTVF